MGYQQTSKDAYESVKPYVPTIKERVYDVIASYGSDGMTTDEIEGYLNLAHQTVSPRVLELRQDGLLKDSGEKRKTISGRKAIVWVASAYA